MTDSGVRSSWEASAVNSSWRRRASSTGAAACTPITSAPRNIPSRTTGAATSSTVSSRTMTWERLATLSPATSQPPSARTARTQKMLWPTRAVVSAPAWDQVVGTGGAAGSLASTAPVAVTRQTMIGVSSGSVLAGGAAVVPGGAWLRASWASSRAAVSRWLAWLARCSVTTRSKAPTARA